MESLKTYFDIPSFYSSMEMVNSERLKELLNDKDPINYMRELFKKDNELFYKVRDELLLRGIGFQEKYSNNYLLTINFKITKVILTTEEANYSNINFSLLGSSNFVERFDVKENQFFNLVPLESLHYFLKDNTVETLEKILLDNGFNLIYIEDYLNSLKSELVIKKETIRDIYNESGYFTFHNYCDLNNIEFFEDLTIDFVENFRHMKSVREKTVLKVKELFLATKEKLNPLKINFEELLSVLNNNSFKEKLEYAGMDYLAILNSFYEADNDTVHSDVLDFSQISELSDVIIQKTMEISKIKKENQVQDISEQIFNNQNMQFIENMTLIEVYSTLNLEKKTVIDEINFIDIFNDENYVEDLKSINNKLESFKTLDHLLAKVKEKVDNRKLNMLVSRKTKTLEEIGEVENVTRERIRQIIKKTELSILNLSDINNINLYFKYFSENVDVFVDLDEFVKYFKIDEIDKEINKAIVGLVFDNNSEIKSLDKFEYYTFNTYFEEVRDGFKVFDSSRKVYPESELIHAFGEDRYESMNKLIHYLLGLENFKLINELLIKDNMRIIDRINYLFDYVIDEPIEMNEEGFELIKYFMEETFSIPFDGHKRAATARIAAGANVILVGPNTFAKHKPEMITDDFIEFLDSVISNTLEKYDYADPRNLMIEHAIEVEQCGIKFPEHLYSIIQMYLGDRYETGKGNTLYISRNSMDKIDASTILMNYLVKNNNQVKKSDILEALKWNIVKLDQLVSRMDTVILIDNEEVKTVESFGFTADDFGLLMSEIDKELEQGYVLPYKLYLDLVFNENFEELFMRTQIDSPFTLYSLIKHFYPNLKGFAKFLYTEDSSITGVEQIVSNEFPNIVTRADLIEYLRETIGFEIQMVDRTLELLLSSGRFKRYSTTKYINTSVLNINQDVLNSLKSYIKSNLEEYEYCPVYMMKNYLNELLPIGDYEWTEVLIAEIASEVGYRAIRTSPDYRYNRPVLVSVTSQIKQYDELVYHIVKTEFEHKYHEENLAKYLASKKISYSATRLATEVRRSELFIFDKFGFFELGGE